MPENNSKVDVSVILPAYNEQDNVFPLYNELSRVLTDKDEIIFIDDGSKDNTLQNLAHLNKKDKRVKVIRFKRNFGQTAALDVGFKQALGEVIVTMDADLQNDPKDIPRLLAKLTEGYDVVTGWRYNRKDTISKKIFSLFANFVRRRLIKDKIHDAGCTLKVFKKECINSLNLYGEMHRYITTILALQGYKVGEIKVNHRQRIHGKTKYGFKRVFKGFFDLMFIKFWNDFSSRPLHFFGSLGVMQYAIATLIFAEQMIKAIIVNELSVGPLLILVVLLLITGSLTFLFGFLAEIMVRTYYKDTKNYVIDKVYK